jgi:AraC-like DNA-binding protein
MFHTVFTTHNLPTNDRLALFDELQANSALPMRAFSKKADRFAARLDALDLAAVDVVELTVSTAEVIRTGRQVHDFDPDLYCLVMPRRGRVLLEQSRNQAALGRGSLALFSSSQPLRVRIEDPDGPKDRRLRAEDMASLVRVQVPKSLFQLPSSKLDRMLARPVGGMTGLGGLLTGFLSQLSTDTGGYSPADLPRLGNLVVDLMTATMAHELDAQLPDEVAESTLMPRITNFIMHNLGDPDLSPPAIAFAHHISVSHLHRLFRTEDTTVGTWVRRQRLEHARRDLHDPRLGEVAVHRIAARWGFRDHASFTRAFRARFGVTPRDYRNAPGLSGVLALAAPPAGTAARGDASLSAPADQLSTVHVGATTRAEHMVLDVGVAGDDAGAA